MFHFNMFNFIEKIMAKTKKCTLCGKRKAISKFYKDATHNDGLQSRCKECQKELRRKK